MIKVSQVNAVLTNWEEYMSDQFGSYQESIREIKSLLAEKNCDAFSAIAYQRAIDVIQAAYDRDEKLHAEYLDSLAQNEIRRQQEEANKQAQYEGYQNEIDEQNNQNEKDVH